MARPINLLTAAQVRTLGPGRHADGKGLYLLVKEAGGASWVVRYKQAGKQRDAGLGAARGGDAVPLAEARARRDALWTMHRGGVDPLAEKAAAKARATAEAQDKRARAVTFQGAAEAYILANQAGWANIKHAAQWRATLTAYAYPHIGALPVAEVGTPHILAALQPIWTTKTETATRVRSRIELVLDYARVREWRSGENPARWRGHMAQLLPKPSKVAAVEHHAALPWGEVPAFMVALAGLDGMGAQALRFAILTAARTGEVIGATWGEVDIKEKAWTIPAVRMKAKREHRVPLAPAAMAILADVAKLRGSGDPALPVFPGQGGKRGLSNMAMLTVLRRMKRDDVTPHGFRSAFRDWASERTTYSPEVAEMALAHAVGDKVEAAYRRGDLFIKRRGLMDDWAAFATTPASAEPGKVISLRTRDTADSADTIPPAGGAGGADDHEGANLVAALRVARLRNAAPDIAAKTELEILSTAIFKARLRKAAQDYEAASAPAGKREAVASVLAAVDMFMLAADMVPYLGPVREGVFALSALDKGIVLPLLEPAPKLHNAPETLLIVKLRRAIVAAALEQRHRLTGRLLRDAAAEVALWLTGSEVFGKTKPSASTILKWREKCMEQSKKSAQTSGESPAQQYYSFVSMEGAKYTRPLPNEKALLEELKIWGIGKKPR